MPWDNSKISVGEYWLVYDIESALMALSKMANIHKDYSKIKKFNLY